MKKTNVLAFCIREIPSARLGVISLMEELQSQGKIVFHFVESSKMNKQLIGQADIAICIRGSEELDIKIVKELKRLNKYVIYFLDDDLLNVPKSAASSLYYLNEQIQHNIKNLISTSDCLWTTNRNIAQNYDLINKHVVVIDVPALCLHERKAESFKSETIKPVVIGFAGSIDHGKFLDQMLDKVIENIIGRYSNVRFEFFGAKPDFIDKYNATHIPYESDYNQYSEIILSRNWDIGLAPLEDSSFHKCKYFNKYLEYASKQIVGVYSNVEPYTLKVIHGSNGFLVDNKHEEWTNMLCYLIENEEMRNHAAFESFNDVKYNHSLSAIAARVETLIPEMVQYKAPYVHESSIRDPFYVKSFYYQKVLGMIKREKFNTPKFIIKKVIGFMRKK
ncbi:hypothetical protein ACFQZE_17740 [Paenibacillus sp. GCM10027627]|uniref:hypothetical protein n=1 Tax=unclassified Paenibacillus TaxID=185978 RepID=UPI0036382ECE